MSRRLAGFLTLAGIAILAVTLSTAQGTKEPPKMTPEQMAEMEAWMKAGTPGPAHQALAKQVGTYDCKIKSWGEPGAPPMEDTGTSTRSMALGGRVLMEDFTGTMMGAPAAGHGMSGYDNVTGKTWGTWTDTMITGLIVTQGTCDLQKNTCSATGSMSDPIKKTQTKVRFASRWPTPTTQIFEMYAPGKDGKEMKMMEITYTKK